MQGNDAWWKGGLRLTVAAASMAFCGPCSGVSLLMHQNGFKELTPPSTFMLPGTIVSQETRHPYTAQVVCTAAEALGPNTVPRESKTPMTQMMKVRGMSMKAKASWLDQIKAEGNYQDVESANISLKNPRILILTDTDVIEARGHRSAACAAAIRKRLSRGDDITMIRQVLVGDMDIEVGWNRKKQLDASVKVAQLQQLAVEVGGNAESTSSTKATATGLIWGITDDAKLMELTTLEVEDGTYPRHHSVLAYRKLQVAPPNAQGRIKLTKFVPQNKPFFGELPAQSAFWAPNQLFETIDDDQMRDHLKQLGRLTAQEHERQLASGEISIEYEAPRPAKKRPAGGAEATAQRAATKEAQKKLPFAFKPPLERPAASVAGPAGQPAPTPYGAESKDPAATALSTRRSDLPATIKSPTLDETKPVNDAPAGTAPFQSVPPAATPTSTPPAPADKQEVVEASKSAVPTTTTAAASPPSQAASMAYELGSIAIDANSVPRLQLAPPSFPRLPSLDPERGLPVTTAPPSEQPSAPPTTR